MNQKLRIGTRKGLFVYERTGKGQWRCGVPDFLGDPVSMVLRDPRNGNKYTALNLGHFGVKLHRAESGSREWTEIDAPKFPKSGDEDGPAVDLIWELVPGGADQPDTLWAGTIPGGLFKSTDRGESWTLIEPLWNRPERANWFGGGYDKPGIHSICVHPNNTRCVRLAISCGGVWESQDAGDTWTQTGQGLRAAFLPPDQAYNPVSQDPHRMVSCPASPDHMWIQHHNGIFRSDDGGHRWTEITDVPPSVFGFAVAVHPQDPNTAWFAPAIKDERRVPVDGKLIINRTRDGGKSFTALSNGLPQGPAYDLTYRHSLDVDDSGDILAFGSTTGGLWVSEDQGDHWQCLSEHLPPIYVVRFDKHF
ncbi:exo-alpha-sialidase [Hahella sp. HN01]|uniref:WD40/YVTN/BNR-like repeat-containing protein n=1 Tax=Hahella sp. HN01 TaxID=2847262 RepID=UPI001C1E9559|nr:exo-alpha-sialidase [Hahella sp. HN01]MBU6955801.1 exo-alpha-sialidase [Hahella sp. HN01]